MRNNNFLRTLRKSLVLRILLALVCLYFFICSLNLLATSFRLLSGKNGGKLFTNSELLNNPIVGVMIGVLATVFVQSSSTTTSVIIGMVAADVVPVKAAIPLVMGANIGTSVTNTIVSFTQIGNREEFKLAFSCAVLHDMFNLLSVMVFLVIEIFTGYLNVVTSAIIQSLQLTSQEKPVDLLSRFTKPFNNLIIQIDKKVLKGWTLNSNETLNIDTLLKNNCKRFVGSEDYITPPPPTAPSNGSAEQLYEKYPCGYIFANTGLSDTWIGVILLVGSLFLMSSCLILLVKILKSLMEAQVAKTITNVLNADIPYMPWLTGYLAILIGAVITFLVQSSSVFTSTLTPLVGTGLFELKRAYPLTLGSNIGTTTTGILAALAAEGDHLPDALQIALCHLFFNISGILLFYPIPFMRWPIPMARIMGETVAKYRWFSTLYLICVFGLFPLYIFGLALVSTYVMYCGFLPIFVFLIIIVIMNVLQNLAPAVLPKFLRNWDFLPEWLRSLDPLDRLVTRFACCAKFRSQNEKDLEMT